MNTWHMIVYLFHAARKALKLNVPHMTELQRLLWLMTALFLLIAVVIHVWTPLVFTLVFTWSVFLQGKSRAYAALQERNSTEPGN